MKRAVILIHGIGEQKPMDALRGFVEGVLGSRTDGQEAFWSKPDPLSDLFELRRLQARGKRAGTHFYEYYWAWQVEGSSLRAVLVWLWGLIWRRSRDMPSSARTLVWIARLSLAGFLALLASGAAGAWLDGWRSLPMGDWRWLLGSAAWLALRFALVNYLGDAARYLSPQPGNIRLRRAIRADGVRLLHALHQRGEYERIIVVGHSLGSVIAYDILNAYWQRVHDRFPGLKSDEQLRRRVREALGGDGPQPVLRKELSRVGELLRQQASAPLRAEFRKAQHRSQLELCALGHPWRVSDLVTLGSPLAHGVLLLARDSAEFEARQRQRELPSCPPQRDEKGYAYGAKTALEIGEGKKYTPLIPHHAAAFAVTRWSNLCAPARLDAAGAHPPLGRRAGPAGAAGRAGAELAAPPLWRPGHARRRGAGASCARP